MIYLLPIIFIPIIVKLFFPQKDVDSTPKRRFAYIFLCGFLIFILMGFRSRYSGSADTTTYCKMFDTFKGYSSFNSVIKNQKLDTYFFLFSESLFYLYVWMIGRIFNHYQFLLIITSLIIIISICYFILKNSKNCQLSLMIFIAFGLFMFSMNGMRQVLAMSICLFAYNFAKDKKIIPFVLVVLLALLFHKSSVLFLIVYFLPNIKYNYKTWILFGACFAFLIIFGKKLSGIFGSLTQKDYENISTSVSGGLAVIAIYLMTIAMTLIYCNKQLKSDNLLRTLLYMSVIGCVLYISRYIISAAFERIHYIFLYPSILLIPYSIDQLDEDNKKVYNVVVSIFAILLFIYRIQNTIFKDFEMILLNLF